MGTNFCNHQKQGILIKKIARLSGENKCIGFVGAAFSRDPINSRLQAAPTGVFFRLLELAG